MKTRETSERKIIKKVEGSEDEGNNDNNLTIMAMMIRALDDDDEDMNKKIAGHFKMNCTPSTNPLNSQTQINR